ncbi:MAG: putative alpha/beta hydrolase [Myxococcaceae bacterium]|nr:putative alpha/beta hydrolase [Myxococcaceae bacterium]
MSYIGMSGRFDLSSRLSTSFDSWLARQAARRRRPNTSAMLTRDLATPVGLVRVFDSASDKPCVVIVPDGPNVIEHYEGIVKRLSQDVRVVCFDMPGFGFSFPRSDYRHTLDEGARAVLGVLDALSVPRATLAFSCANGLYALRAARLAPKRVHSLFLSQTPSLHAMQTWAERVIAAPLRKPLLGQASVWFGRHALAEHWYGMSLPRGIDPEPFRAPARAALVHGGCFSLAGIVQGLLASSQKDLLDVSTRCTMLWGEQDRTHRGTNPSSLRDCAVQAQILRLENVGHFPDLEAPERYATLLLADATNQ